MGGIDATNLARLVRADVDQAAPLLSRILFIRALRLRDHWVARDLMKDGMPAVADAACREIAHSLAPTHDVDRDLGPAMAALVSYEAARRREDVTYTAYSLSTDPDIPHDRDRVLRTSREWDAERATLRAAEQRMPRNLGAGLTGSVLLDRALARVFRRGLLFQLRDYWFASEPEAAWRRQLTRALLGAARAAGSRGHVLETVPAGPLTSSTPSAWARAVGSRFEDEPLAAGRLTALCLSGEPDAPQLTYDVFTTLLARAQ